MTNHKDELEAGAISALEVFANRRLLAHSLRGENSQLAAFVESMGIEMDAYFDTKNLGSVGTYYEKLETAVQLLDRAIKMLDQTMGFWGGNLDPTLLGEYKRFKARLGEE